MSHRAGSSPRDLVGRSLSWLALAAGLALLVPGSPVTAQQPVTIKMASLLPSGSEGHNVLLQMAEDWKKASGGRVILRIYPGQTMGDDPDVVRAAEREDGLQDSGDSGRRHHGGVNVYTKSAGRHRPVNSPGGWALRPRTAGETRLTRKFGSPTVPCP